MLTPQELFDLMIVKAKEIAPDKEFNKLNKAMLMECCENVIANENAKDMSTDSMMLAALSALQVCQGMMKGLISGLIPQAGDIVNLTYRGETYTFDKNSPILN